jgi:hypothetical protein
MTLFVKSEEDWFYCLTRADYPDSADQEMIMRSMNTEAVFLEKIIDYYDCPYEVNESYLAIEECGKSNYVYFDGLVGDDKLQFTQVSMDRGNILFTVDRLGQGDGFFIPRRFVKLKGGDVVTLNGAKSTVLHSDDNITLLSQNSGINMYLTDQLTEVVY